MKNLKYALTLVLLGACNPADLMANNQSAAAKSSNGGTFCVDSKEPLKFIESDQGAGRRGFRATVEFDTSDLAAAVQKEITAKGFNKSFNVYGNADGASGSPIMTAGSLKYEDGTFDLYVGISDPSIEFLGTCEQSKE